MAAWRQLVACAVVVITLVGFAFAVPAAAQSQSSGIDLTVTATEASAGENVTVTFTAENAGSDPVAVIVDISDRPDGWTIQGHEDAGGVWRDDGKWLFQTVEGGESVSPTVTFSVPENAAGEYSIGGNASTGSSSATDEVSLSIGTENGESGGETNSPVPGFGITTALVALVGIALLVGRRR